MSTSRHLLTTQGAQQPPSSVGLHDRTDQEVPTQDRGPAQTMLSKYGAVGSRQRRVQASALYQTQIGAPSQRWMEPTVLFRTRV
mmetsp:Transcript_51793/g.118092  ORF Transcript_51793/g.118092 Transcript_51793/m.118092 type:complete len:84 (-) Transcript_51793:469-720(-)